MKVQILKANRRISGEAGDVVTCDPSVGNALACLGYVKVLEHAKPTGPRARVQRSGKEPRKDDDQ